MTARPDLSPRRIKRAVAELDEDRETVLDAVKHDLRLLMRAAAELGA